MEVQKENIAPNSGSSGESAPPPHATAYQNGQERPGGPDFQLIIGAPDFTTLIKQRQSAKSKEYSTKIGSLLKACTIAALQSGEYADAATLLYHGPGAATAVGNVCDINERVAHIVDVITSPESPYVVLGLAVLPLVSQLMRNHETSIQAIPSKFNGSKQARAERKRAKAIKRAETKPTFTIKAFGKRIPVRINLNAPRFMRTFLAGVHAQTQEPNTLAAQVFTNPDVLKAFEKAGIIIRASEPQK